MIKENGIGAWAACLKLWVIERALPEGIHS
jgi:hypothetical protein